MPALLLLVIFVVVPLAELYVLIQVGQAIGALPTIGLLLLDSVLGTLLMRTQGAAAWRRFNEALAAGRLPHREVADGFLVILGGALLLAPGFLTDIFGVLLLLPPTRALIRPVILRVLVRRAMAGGRGGPGAPGGGFAFGRVPGAGGAQPGFGFGGGAGRTRDDADGDVVDGTAHDVDPKHLR